LAELRGRPVPSSEAELWFGAHPDAPAEVETTEGAIPLDAWIARDPVRALGASGGDTLPFLLKILAVAAPLSLQAHPNAEQARAGFAREQRDGPPVDAPTRSYRDPFPKPELVCALGPFQALKGFRAPAEIAADLARLGEAAPPELANPLRERPDADGWRDAFAAFLGLPRERAAKRVEAVVAALAGRDDAPARTLRRLAEAYPGDPGVLAALYLNPVTLAPGQALFLPAGELHCYLDGLAVEVMACSDNVLRGGLTAKHVDRGELLRIVRFEPGDARPIVATPGVPGERCWPTPAREFRLSRLDLEAGGMEVTTRRGPEILLCTAGTAQIEPSACERLAPGQAAWVPAAAGPYRASAAQGTSTLYRVTRPA
jgi:mannose-6-phosphate isomerase